MNEGMRELKNWTEVTRGLYRYVVAAKVCYEIHVIHRKEDTDILAADANLYIVGEWHDSDGITFERELLWGGTVFSCINAAVKDNKENNK